MNHPISKVDALALRLRAPLFAWMQARNGIISEKTILTFARLQRPPETESDVIDALDRLSTAGDLEYSERADGTAVWRIPGSATAKLAPAEKEDDEGEDDQDEEDREASEVVGVLAHDPMPVPRVVRPAPTPTPRLVNPPTPAVPVDMVAQLLTLPPDQLRAIATKAADVAGAQARLDEERRQLAALFGPTSQSQFQATPPAAPVAPARPRRSPPKRPKGMPSLDKRVQGVLAKTSAPLGVDVIFASLQLQDNQRLALCSRLGTMTSQGILARVDTSAGPAYRLAPAAIKETA